jgi:16S rRNA (cytosine967-C5)-methyltransferase
VTGPAKRASSRDVALAVVRDVFGPSHRRAQDAFDYRARRAGLTARDRAFAAQLAYGSIKMRRTIDWYLAPYLRGRDRSLPAPIAEALRLGVYQLRFMGGVDAHAAVFETVNAALHVGHRGTAGLVNAVLRRFAADAPAEPERAAFDSDDDYLGTRFSVPTWLVATWRERLGDALEPALDGVDRAPQAALRVNLLRGSIGEAETALAALGVEVRRSPLVSDALIVTDHPHATLADEAEERWSPQGESACVPVDLLDPRPGERVLDLCSGRGNKAIQIASRARDEQTLTCFELDERAAEVLERRLASAGVANAAVVRGDARGLGAELVADAVLVDAPCSGLGVIGRHPEARWRKSPDDGAHHAPLQRALLDAAAGTVRAGGRLVYAVCSIDPREGEAVVAPFLAARPAFARAPLPERYAPFATADGDVAIAPGIDGRDGFYVASLRRDE